MSSPNHTALRNVRPIERTNERENEIVKAAKAGSPGAFADLHAMYAQRLYHTIVGITKSPEDAEDALQETFLRAYLAIDRFEGRSTLYSWLTRIAINSALMILRKRRARPEVLFIQSDPLAEAACFEIKDSAPDPEEAYDQYQRRATILRAMRKLDVCLRRPIRMRMAKGSSVKEIGKALNISESAVKARLYRARLRLYNACQKS